MPAACISVLKAFPRSFVPRFEEGPSIVAHIRIRKLRIEDGAHQDGAGNASHGSVRVRTRRRVREAFGFVFKPIQRFVGHARNDISENAQSQPRRPGPAK